jgi:hypothetical protein
MKHFIEQIQSTPRAKAFAVAYVAFFVLMMTMIAAIEISNFIERY